MKMRTFAALLALLLLLTAVACGKREAATDTSVTTEATTTAVQTEAPPAEEFFTLTADAHIVRPEGDISESMTMALRVLLNAGNSLLGTSVKATEDWYRGEPVRAEYEILLGETNRPESREAYDTLTYHDYMYEVVSPHVVVICGGNDMATLKGVQQFLRDCYGCSVSGAGGQLKDIPVGTAYTYRHSYALTSLTLCGEDIATYTIVHEEGQEQAARMLRSIISRDAGVNLPLLPREQYRGGNALCLGFGTLQGGHLRNDLGAYSYLISYQRVGEDHVIFADTRGKYELLAQAFGRHLLARVPGEGTYDIALTPGEQVCCLDATELNDFGLVAVSEPETLADGVVYTKRSYRDASNGPVIAYVLEVDPARVDVVNATPNNGTVIHNVKATTEQAMRALAADGYAVIAGVNADFFRISSDYSPSGLCIKDGRVLSGANNRPWFGVTHDGAAVMGTAADYAKYAGKLKEAVGGSTILLKDGLCTGSHGEERHPRTAVGVRADGTLLLVVVDGRQPSISNGASMNDMTALFLELGAVDAINLDGGGSSSLITVNSAGSYVTRNSPSDGKLRSVFNSLVVVGKGA